MAVVRPTLHFLLPRVVVGGSEEEKEEVALEGVEVMLVSKGHSQ